MTLLALTRLRQLGPSLILVSLLAALGACGGKARDGDSEDGGGTSTGSHSAAGGHSSGGAESAGGANTSGGADGSGGASACREGSGEETCFPGAIRFEFDTRLGICVPTLGGFCENTFETQKECDATCRGGEVSPSDTCQTSSECRAEFFGCCDLCEPSGIELFEAVNERFIDYLHEQSSKMCGPVSCGACEEGDAVSQNYGAVCEEGRCELYDVRAVPDYSSCEVDSDCTLRNGLSCCDACGGTEWVAVNHEPALSAELCGDDPVVCPACVSPLPTDRRPACVDGTCLVVPLE